jgi:hypothetical protein
VGGQSWAAIVKGGGMRKFGGQQCVGEFFRLGAKHINWKQHMLEHPRETRPELE